MNPERETIRQISEAVAGGILGEAFGPADVNRLLGIAWGGNFLVTHLEGNPGKKTVFFVRVARGIYRLSQEGR